MDPQEIAEWMKSSVLGILLLGTLGSLVAVLVLDLARRIFLEVLPARYRVLRALLSRDQYVNGYVMGALAATQDIGSHFTYFAFLFARFATGLVMGLFFAIAFLLMRYAHAASELTSLSYATLVLSFLSLLYAAFTIRPIMRAYVRLIAPIVDRGNRAFKKDDSTPTPTSAPHRGKRRN